MTSLPSTDLTHLSDADRALLDAFQFNPTISYHSRQKITPHDLSLAHQKVQLALHQGADPSATRYSSIGSYSAVHLAIFTHNAQALETLIQAGADLHLYTFESDYEPSISLIEHALNEKDITSVQVLFKYHAPFFDIPKEKITSHPADKLADLSLANFESLLPLMDLTRSTAEGNTVLIHLINANAPLTHIKALLDHSSDANMINHQNNHQEGVLHKLVAGTYSSFYDSLRARYDIDRLNLLLQAGADIHLKNSADFTATQLAYTLLTEAINLPQDAPHWALFNALQAHEEKMELCSITPQANIKPPQPRL